MEAANRCKCGKEPEERVVIAGRLSYYTCRVCYSVPVDRVMVLEELRGYRRPGRGRMQAAVTWFDLALWNEINPKDYHYAQYIDKGKVGLYNES